jgi:hypothetical protein
LATQTALTISSTSASYNGTAFTLPLTTTGGSGTGAVTYVLNAGGSATSCAVSGSTLTASSSGTCFVTATKAADTHYLAASSPQTTITFNLATQAVLTITSTNGTSTTSSYTLNLTTTGGTGAGAVSYAFSGTNTASGCAIAGSTLTAASSGTCVVTATKAADTHYNAVSSISTTIVFSPATTITGFTTNKLNGIPAQGDVITITFSAAVNPTTICSGWTGTGAQTTNNSTNVTVTMTKQTSGDNTLSLSDVTDCGGGGFNIFLGNSLDLGTTGYVTTTGTGATTAVFSNGGAACGSSNQCSEVALDTTDKILTITIGALTSGTVGTVTTNPGVIYSPSTALLDANGNQISGTKTDSATKFF